MTPLSSIGSDLMGEGRREGGRLGRSNSTISSSSSSKSTSTTTTTTNNKNNKKKRKTPASAPPLSVAAATAAAVKAGREGGQASEPTPAQLRQVAKETGLGLQEVLNVWKKLRKAVGGTL